MVNFCNTVDIIINKFGWSNVTLSDLISRWKSFISECIEGYSYSIYEYDNELFVRDKIQMLLSADVLKEFKEYEELSNTVDNIDTSLKEIFHPNYKRDDNRWWWKGILKYAGSEYCNDVESLYGAKIDEVD